jgi:hypothetical protein
MKKIFLLVLFACGFLNTHLQAASAWRSDTIDIRKTIIDFNITDFITKNITATTVLDIKSKMNNVTELVFDLEGLIVDSTKVNGVMTSFTHSGQFLKINLNNSLNLGDIALVSVSYHGVPIADPQWGGFSYVGNYGFQMGVGFNAQPHTFGRTWHPCFDNFVERSAYEFYITTTNDKMAVCNGLLLDSVHQPNATITWHWKLNEEIPSYLSSVAVCNYIFVKQVLTGNVGNVDAWIACEPVDSNKVVGSFAHLQESFTMLENNFGTYLWPRVGYSLVPFNAGAMEHATNIHIGRPFVDGTLNYETLIAHELSHHWWGDLVTCSTVGDMWINEGFASYCELLHQEFTYGSDRYQSDMRANHYNVLNKAHISDEGYRSVANMDSLHTYGATVYNKGSDVIHSLRSYLGDSLFFNGLTAFLTTNKFKDVSSAQLRDFMTNYSGIDLNHFFDNWLFAPGFTHFSIDSSHSTNIGNVWATEVFLRQRKHQSTDYYTNVPLEVGFYDAQMNLYVYQITFTGRCLQFNVNLPFEPQMIVIDPHSKISDAITEETKIIKSLATVNLPQAKIKIYPKAIITSGDSTMLRIEHSWVAPDRFKTPLAANAYVLCDTRYWKIDAINLSNLQGILQFSYDGGINNSYLDSAWVKNTEDSIHIFYRKDATEEWQIANDSLKVGALNDKVGVVYVKEIKVGEYCFGIKKSNYVDPIITDAPTGGCNVVTTVHTTASNQTFEPMLFPNPAHDEINILFFNSHPKDLNFKVCNMNGITQWQKSAKTSNDRLTISLPTLAAGLYYMTIEDLITQQRYVKKIVIQ